MIRRAAAGFLFAALLAGPAALRAEEPGAALPLRKGDALLVHIEGLGGGLPEYREIVDSDGQIELPFLGMVAAAGKTPAAVADSLLRHVPDCPAELAARLALVHVADADTGQPLAPGEWLVTRDGRLRRWDGFIAGSVHSLLP